MSQITPSGNSDTFCTHFRSPNGFLRVVVSRHVFVRVNMLANRSQFDHRCCVYSILDGFQLFRREPLPLGRKDALGIPPSFASVLRIFLSARTTYKSVTPWFRFGCPCELTRSRERCYPKTFHPLGVTSAWGQSCGGHTGGRERDSDRGGSKALPFISYIQPCSVVGSLG